MTGPDPPVLDEAIAALYGGPVEAFVRRRDALAKELRGAGRKDDAAEVKSLRKPARLAWALNRAVLGSPELVDLLDGVVAETLGAHAGGGDVRGAIARLRSAVREVGARAAEAAGEGLEATALAHAVQAVLGRSESFDALRRGRLVDVPDAGGLDFLASLPVPAELPGRVREAPKPPIEATDVTGPDEQEAAREAAREAAARTRALEALEVARAVAAGATADAEAASARLREAEGRLAEAEQGLREAETELRLRRGEREKAREAVEAAAVRRHETARVLAEAEAALARHAGRD